MNYDIILWAALGGALLLLLRYPWRRSDAAKSCGCGCSHEPSQHDPFDPRFTKNGHTQAWTCPFCGSAKGTWFSRTTPMGNICEDCGQNVDGEREPEHISSRSGSIAQAIVKNEFKMMQELEQAKADRNRAGVEERRKYLPRLQALSDLCRLYHKAWDGYKVFPSLANENLFAEAETMYKNLLEQHESK